jgi:hypothetical protein
VRTQKWGPRAREESFPPVAGPTVFRMLAAKPSSLRTRGPILLDNIKAILAADGITLDKVVSTTVFVRGRGQAGAERRHIDALWPPAFSGSQYEFEILCVRRARCAGADRRSTGPMFH